MSLRVKRAHAPAAKPASDLEGLQDAPQPGEVGDDWGARVAKLIPAEALGFYGTAVGLVSTGGAGAPRATLVVIALVACVLIFLVRFRATREAGGTEPQLKAIAISLISFLIWLGALAATGEGSSPFPQSWAAPYAPLAALIWGTLIPYFYKGD